MRKQNKRNVKKNRKNITNRAKSTFRKSERKVGKGAWSKLYTISSEEKNVFQTATVAYLGKDIKEDQESDIYYATVMCHPFEIYVTPIDFSRGEITITLPKDNKLDLESCAPYLQTLTELFIKEGFTGKSISTDQLAEEMKDTNKKILTF